MCGIAGFAEGNKEKIERMTGALAHRGPDGRAAVVLEAASLGHARLAILDPRPEGDQPMWNDDHTIAIVYNGEIFNYRELRDAENFACRTGTDTEVLLKLYERHGMTFLPRLRGMFAFGIYDTKSRTWHLARDPSGIKPLFVAYPNGKLHFASEMRALMSALPGKPPLNFTALSRYLRLQYVPGPETLCEGITALPPGTVLTWSEQTGEKRRIVQPHVEPMSFASQEEFRSTFPALMDTVVADHLVSDKPVGIFLSGGMDSSILLHHMAQHAVAPVRTFTVRFEATEEEGAERFNTDADFARRTALHYGTEHHEIYLTAQTARAIYRDTARALDQPNADSVAMAQVLLAREAKKCVDVALVGAGGDELFGGYPRYRAAHILHALRHIPPSLRSLAGHLGGYPPDVLAMQPGPMLAERLLARPSSELQEVTKGDWFDPAATTHLFEERWPTAEKIPQFLNSSIPQFSDVRSFMEFDRHLWLVDESLRLADATTMASGLEARVPFLDPRIIAASHATPARWHVTWTRTKALLKETYAPLLPPHLRLLAKACFYPPLAKWLRRECAPLVEEMLESPRIRELFSVEKVRHIYEQHKRHERYALHTLSSLTQLSHWFDTVYDA